MTSRWGRYQEPITLIVVAALVLVAVAAPWASLAWELLTASRAALTSLASPALWALLGRSVARALLTTILAVILGLPLGVLLARTNVTGRSWAFALHVFPMFLPPFLLALGWFYLLCRQGPLGSELGSRVLFGECGVLVTHTLAFSPVVTALVMLGLSGVDPALEDAGRTAASPWRVITRISVPLIWPSLALAALIVFALALADMGVPMFLRVPTYPAMVFTRLGGVDYAPGEAFVLTLPLVGIAMLVLGLEMRVARCPIAMVRLVSFRRFLPLGRARMAVTVACWAWGVVSSLPMLGLLMRAFRGDGFKHISAWIGGSLGNSILDALCGATFITGLGTVLGWALARGRRVARVANALMSLTFVVPAAVLGVGLIATWNRRSTDFLYSSAGIIILGYLARYAVIGVRPIAAAIAQSSVTLEEAASALGVGFLRRLARLVLPSHARAIAWAWLLALVFCLRDLESAILYYPPGGETLPVRIFTLEANGSEAIVAALSLVHVATTAFVLGAGALLLRRRR